MNDASSKIAHLDRESRAREWIRTLSELPARFAGTTAEREAANRVADWMRGLGAADVSVSPTPGAPRAGYGQALHAGLGALGCWIGGPLGVMLAALSLWSFRREFRQRRPLLASLLPSSPSVNVVGRMGGDQPVRRVVLSAHIDAAQAGWMFSREFADRFAGFAAGVRRGGPPPGPLAIPEALLAAATVVAAAAWLGAHGPLFGLIRLAAVFALLVVFALTLQWSASEATPGANDNASAVAAMLLCAERLKERLPADTELWLVGTGAEEVGCVGIDDFTERHADWPRERTYFVNFECVGGGSLHFIRSEGLLKKVYFPSEMVDLSRRVAAGGGFGEVTPTDLLANTDGHVPAERGYPVLSLISLEPNGVPRNYHRREDTVDGIDTATVVRAADFGAAVAAAALRGEGKAITEDQVVSC